MCALAAMPAGGFIFGLLHAGDPDPNPVGRVVYAGLMAVMTPLHAGFPPHDGADAGQSSNAWPHIAIAWLLLSSWSVYRDGKLSKKRNEPPAS